MLSAHLLQDPLELEQHRLDVDDILVDAVEGRPDIVFTVNKFDHC